MQSCFLLLWTTRRSLKVVQLDAVMESLLDQILWMFTFSFTFSFSIKTIHSFAMSSLCQNAGGVQYCHCSSSLSIKILLNFVFDKSGNSSVFVKRFISLTQFLHENIWKSSWKVLKPFNASKRAQLHIYRTDGGK